MADRKAELLIKATLDAKDVVAGAEQASEATKQLGGAVESTTAATSQAAAATDTLTAAQEQAAAASAELAGRSEQTGAVIIEASAEAATAVDKVTAAEEKASASAQEMRVDLDALSKSNASVREIAQSFSVVADGIRQSDLALEAQRVGVQAMTTQLEALLREQVAMGSKGREGADVYGAALLELKGRLGEINTGIKNVLTGTEEVERGALDFETVMAGATARVKESWEQLDETFKITPKQLSNTVQAAELARIKLEEMAAAGITATPEQIARLEALNAEINKLNGVANRLTNAAKDNSVSLQETGAQIQGVAVGVQQLTSLMGAGAAKLGTLVGGAGQAASMFEQMKDAIAPLNLNTLSLSSSTATLSVQLGLVALALTAGAAAGKAISETNEENVDSWGKIKKATIDYATGVKGPIKSIRDEMNGLQRVFQDAAAGAYNLGKGEGGLGQSTYEATAATHDLHHALSELGIAVLAGRSGITLYNAALAEGIPPAQAEKIAWHDSAIALDFYTKSLHAGKEGHDLWAQGLREAQGDGEKFDQFIREHSKQIEHLTSVEALATAAREESNKANEELKATLSDLNRQFKEINWDSPEVQVYAKMIADLAGKVRGLSQEERERLALVTQLLAKGQDIDAFQKRDLEFLLQQISLGQKANAVQLNVIKSRIDLEMAINGSAKSLKEASDTLFVDTANWELNRQRIRGAIEAMQAALDKTDNLTDAQRRGYQERIALARAQESELERFEQLDAARTARRIEDEGKTKAAISERITELSRLVGASQQYGVQIEQIGNELSDLLGHTTKLSGAERDRLAIIADLSSRASTLTTGEREIAAALLAEVAAGRQATLAMNELAQAKIAAAGAGAGLTIAIDGTTASLNADLDAVLKLLPQNELHAVQLGRLADLLTQQASSTEGLTKAERDRIEEIADLIKKGDELTETEKRYIETLAFSIEHGNYQIKTLTQLGAAEEARVAGVRAQIAAIADLIAEKEKELGIDKKQTDINLDAGASIDYLRAKQAQLTKELEPQLTVVRATSEAKKDQGLEVERLAQIIDKERNATDQLNTSRQQLTITFENGKTIIGQLADAEGSAADASIKVADATLKSAEAQGHLATKGGSAAQAMKDLLGTIPLTGDQLRALLPDLTKAADEMGRLAENTRKMNDHAAAAAQ